MSIRELVKNALKFYPNSKNMRKQYVRKTLMLIESSKHVLYGAKPKWGNGNV